MRRRAYLGALAGVGLVAGCTGGEDGAGGTPTTTVSATPTRTRTATPTATETATSTETPEATVPRIERANLVWSSEGENAVAENAIESAGAGTMAGIGVRAALEIAAGEIRPNADIVITDGVGNERQTVSASDSFEVAGEDDVVVGLFWEADLSDLRTGTYSASVEITDRVSGDSTERTTFEFDLVEPLQPNEVELVEYEPSRVAVGEPFRWELRLRNLAPRDSSLISPLTIRFKGANEGETLGRAFWELPAESTVTHSTFELPLEADGTFVMSFSAVDVSWETEVTP